MKSANIPVRFAFSIALVSSTLIEFAESRASTVALHVGSSDPESEGWSRNRQFEGVEAFPVSNDQGTGLDAWAVDDNSISFGSVGIFESTISETVSSIATTSGWTLTSVARVVDGLELDSSSGDSSSRIRFQDEETRWSLLLGKQPDGSPLVGLPDNEQTHVVDLGELDDSYHSYELRFTPATGTADLFVDGAIRFVGFSGRKGTFTPNSIQFGSTAHSLTGHANFNLVSFEVNATFRASDFDKDGDVDGDDFLIWQTSFPTLDGTATSFTGDANEDGNVDGEDFLVWQEEFGSSLESATGRASVPEPSTTAVAIGAMAAILLLCPPQLSVRRSYARLRG